ncbi:DUF4097 family beta strand repeat-containing protein [Streptomyces sp. NPDC048566]|uniref:DUF4097 family beta strand repeat-containing protein n=1 Tax=Streptomyces sp. NPDC048566 TaxID=3365569 RepID=UPI0037236F0D
MQKFATPAPISAVLAIPAGHVRLVAADGTDTGVEILPADPSKGADVKAAERIDVSCSDGVLRVEAAEAGSRLTGTDSGAVDVTVRLPAGSHVEARTAAADISGTGRLGDVTLDAAQGTVTLDEAGSARITLLAGDITVRRLGGPAEISTRKGDLTVAEATRGTVSLRTEAGHITVGAAPGVSATLDAGTGYGRVDNALTNTAGAAAGLAIHATTAYGDITARSN